MENGMAAARFHLLERLTPEEQASAMDCHNGNPQHWQEERPEEETPHYRKR
jgi:hypothetical protein